MFKGSINGFIAPFTNVGGIPLIGQYNGSVDIEIPYYKNYTSFNVSLVQVLTGYHKLYIFSHTNKGTFLTGGLAAGIVLLKITGIPKTDCQMTTDVNTALFILKGNTTRFN